MAIIKCPECGKEVSSNSNQCIHCGCKFTVCPECGHAEIGETSVCPQCGFSFKKNETAVAEQQDSKLDGDVFKQWQQASSSDKLMMTVLKIVKYAAYILPAVFIVVFYVVFTQWQKTDVLEKAVTFDKTRDTLLAMTILSCIFGIIDFESDTAIKFFVKLRCSSWIRQSKIDGITYLKIHRNDKNDDNYQLFAESVYYADNPQRKNIVYVRLIVYLLCAVAVCACIGVCGVIFVDGAMNAAIAGENYSFQYITLIPLGIALAISIVLVIVLETIGGKQYKAWFTKITEEAIKESCVC